MQINSKRNLSENKLKEYYPKSKNVTEYVLSLGKRLDYLERNHLKIISPANNDPINFELNDDVLPLASTKDSVHYLKNPEAPTELATKQYVDAIAKLDSTGDATIDGNLTIAGDIQVNGDDIKCDGAMNLEAEDGAITLDSSNGRFLAKKDGTEFSVANSSFAGMIIGYKTIGIDATTDNYILTTSMAVPDSALGVKFIAPPSGVVEISAQIYFDTSRRVPVLGLSDNATYSAIDFPNANDVTNEHIQSIPPSSLGDHMLRPKWVVYGLTAGTAYEWWLGAKTSAGLGGILKWGGTATNEYPPFIMKAVALPTAISEYAVYG